LIIDDDIRKVLYGDPLKIKKTIVYIYRYLLENCGTRDIALKISDTNTKNTTRLRFSFCFDNIDNNYQNLFVKPTIDTEIINRLMELQKAKLDIRMENNKVVVEILINQKFVEKYEIDDDVIRKVTLKEYVDCSNKRVLVVDDNIGKINNLIDMLKPYNLTVDVAHNYQEYENKIYGDDTWDLILLDDMMPDTNKFEFFNLSDEERYNSLMNVEKITNKRLPLVIMLTKNKDDLGKIEYDYLLKPIKVRELDLIIKKYLVK